MGEICLGQGRLRIIDRFRLEQRLQRKKSGKERRQDALDPELDLVNGVDGRDGQALRPSGAHQARLDGRAGTGKMPRSRPSGSKTQTPSATATYTRPALSTFIPSGPPGRPGSRRAKTRLEPGFNSPEESTSNART